MDFVRAKKGLGQHFLKDRNIARKIVESLRLQTETQVLEIGPGMGILTGFLLEEPGIRLKLVEIDPESVGFLKSHFIDQEMDILEADILKIPVHALFSGSFSVIGNFPYNISSQIFFRILEWRNQVPQVVGMVQKEVAERISSAPGNKTYGILSVLLQAYYHIDFLFTVNPSVFVPPPKVKSAVIRLRRNERNHLSCDESAFVTVVKTAFNQRRKMLSNALHSLSASLPEDLAGKRAEQLSVDEFVTLTRHIFPGRAAGTGDATAG